MGGSKLCAFAVFARNPLLSPPTSAPWHRRRSQPRPWAGRELRARATATTPSLIDPLRRAEPVDAHVGRVAAIARRAALLLRRRAHPAGRRVRAHQRAP